MRPRRTFRQAATEYLSTVGGKATIADDAMHLRLLDPFIGGLALDQVHMGTLRPFVEARRRTSLRYGSRGVKTRTINYALQVVRRIPFLAANE